MSKLPHPATTFFSSTVKWKLFHWPCWENLQRLISEQRVMLRMIPSLGNFALTFIGDSFFYSLHMSYSRGLQHVLVISAHFLFLNWTVALSPLMLVT